MGRLSLKEGKRLVGTSERAPTGCRSDSRPIEVVATLALYAGASSL
jgi:hypothetical protein